MATDTITTTKDKPKAGKPKWLRVKLPTGQKYTQLRSLVDKYDLHT
ncbi:MAG TPA: lipoyl synthase, partial [Flavobacteriaceae bacterium]|nr:lipoyl synthase [Flavobacteriaceae bacterium]